MDYRMRDGIVRNYAGQPKYSGSRAFTSYSVCHISPFARREAGFMALCDDGKVRRYDAQLASYEGAGARADAVYGLEKTYGVKPDAKITHVDVKADGRWMVLTTDNAVYLASVDDLNIARLDMDPKKKPEGNFKFMKAMFDTSIEVDVENTDMTEEDVGAYIVEEDKDEPTMVTWKLRSILRGTPERIIGGDDLPEGENLVVFEKGTTKRYGECHSSPQAAQPAANNETVDDWTYVAAGNRGTALFSVAALADGIKTMTV